MTPTLTMTQHPPSMSLPNGLIEPAVGTEMPPLSIVEIMQYIPHRPPFLLIDRVTRHLYGQRIEGYKQVTMNEPYFVGHFPGNPIMPGVLQIEALAQLGGVLIAHTPSGKGKLAVFAGVDGARFRQMVTPGDRLDLFCELTKFRASIGKSHCWAEVNGKKVVEAELMFSLIDPEPLSGSANG